MRKTVDKSCYDEYRKEVCEKNGTHKPNHSLSLTLCKLDEIIDLLKKCDSDNQEILTQSGVVNVNVESLVNNATNMGKKKS